MMDSEEKVGFRGPKGCQAKRDLKGRRENPGSAPARLGETPSSLACRVLLDFGWAAPGSQARRAHRVSLDHRAPLACLGCRDCLELTVFQDSLGSLQKWAPYPLSGSS